MTKNLNVDKFRNGDPITEAKTKDAWKRAGINRHPAWCYYDFNPSNEVLYGKLYNWYAVNDPRGLAPNGWHIPTEEEWTKLENYLGDSNGTKMKSPNIWNKEGYLLCLKCASWTQEYRLSNYCNTCENKQWHYRPFKNYVNGTNESGFSGVPGGWAHNGGDFQFLGQRGSWWSADDFRESTTFYRSLHSYSTGFSSGGTMNKQDGFSVRCIKD